jgi:hypothetical protein
MTLCGIADLFRRITGVGGGIPYRRDVPEFQNAREATERLRRQAIELRHRLLELERSAQ